MKRFASVLVLAAIAVVAFQYLFGWDEWISRLESWVRATGNPWIFVFAMGVGCAFALPLSFTYLYAGMAFGTLAGWSLSLAGLFISGTVGFIMGRYVLDDVSAEKFRAKAEHLYICFPKNVIFSGELGEEGHFECGPFRQIQL